MLYSKLKHNSYFTIIDCVELVGGEVGQSTSAEDQAETNNNLHIPSITITTAPLTQEMPPPSGKFVYFRCMSDCCAYLDFTAAHTFLLNTF